MFKETFLSDLQNREGEGGRRQWRGREEREKEVQRSARRCGVATAPKV